MSAIQYPEDEHKGFIPQVSSTSDLAASKTENEFVPLPSKKFITAGEAISKLNTILDVQARIQPFELRNDRPARKFPRAEPVSGSVRLAQLVSLERELKEALYFRSLESPWKEGNHPSLGKFPMNRKELIKHTENFHQRLLQDSHVYDVWGSNPDLIPTPPISKSIKASSSVSNPKNSSRSRTTKKIPKPVKEAGSKWPWTFQGKPGRKMWEPFPDTYVRPWESWTNLREKTARPLSRPKNPDPPESHHSRIYKMKAKLAKSTRRWEPETHKKYMEAMSKLNYRDGDPSSPKPKYAYAKTTTFNSNPPEEATIVNPPDLPSSPRKRSKVGQQQSNNRSGFFRMPPLKVMSVSIPGVQSHTGMLQELPSNPSSLRKLSNFQKSSQDPAMVEDVPTTYPQPWQSFKYPDFRDRWNPNVYKPSGSLWEKSLIRLPNEKEKLTQLQSPSLSPDESMDLSCDQNSQLLSQGSTATMPVSQEISRIRTEYESFAAKHMDSLYSVFAPMGGLYAAAVGGTTRRNLVTASSINSDGAKVAVFPEPVTTRYYIDRGLENALSEVQKALRTAIPAFKLDKGHRQPTAHEMKTDEWMKKFIEQMTTTTPHKVRLPLPPIVTFPGRVKSKNGDEEDDNAKSNVPVKLPRPVPNNGDILIVYVDCGKPTVPEFLVGGHENTFLPTPKTFNFPSQASQRITRCTVCAPYCPDGRPATPKQRTFCRNVPMMGLNDSHVFLKYDAKNNKIIVNGLRPANGDECYRNVTHTLNMPEGMSVQDFEIYRSDKGTLFFHDGREEAQLRKREEQRIFFKNFRIPRKLQVKTVYSEGYMRN